MRHWITRSRRFERTYFFLQGSKLLFLVDFIKLKIMRSFCTYLIPRNNLQNGSHPRIQCQASFIAVAVADDKTVHGWHNAPVTWHKAMLLALT